MLWTKSGDSRKWTFRHADINKIDVEKNQKEISWLVGWCFTALRHILGHFGRDQLT